MASPSSRKRKIDKAAYKRAYPACYARDEPAFDESNPFGCQNGRVVNCGEEYSMRDQAAFAEFRASIDSLDGWTEKGNNSKDGLWVWTKDPDNPEETDFTMLKCFAVMPDVPPWVMYDTLHDSVYRASWDMNMVENGNIAGLDLNNDVGYYQAKSPFPSMIANRDLCNHRSWINIDGKEFIIMNSSRKHRECPVREGVVRAWSFKAGFLIRPHGRNSSTITMLAHSDPAGSIPAFVVNQLISVTAPGSIKKMYDAAKGYNNWKKADPNRQYKPWITPPRPWPEGMKPKNRIPDQVFSKGGNASWRPPAGEASPGPPDDWYRSDSMLWYIPGAPLYDAKNQEQEGLLRRVFPEIQDAAAGAAVAPPVLEEPVMENRVDWRDPVERIEDHLRATDNPVSSMFGVCLFWCWIMMILTGAAAVGYFWKYIGILVAVPSASIIGGLSVFRCFSRHQKKCVLKITEVNAGEEV